jgi:hypothetical protein
MSDTNTQENVETKEEVATETETETVKKKRVSQIDFCDAFNAVAKGTATFTEASKPNKTVKVTKAGELVPQTRMGLAALLGMKYNAVVNRERNYREAGVNLLGLAAAKRGASLDVEALNAAIAESAKEDEAADAATS